MKLSFTCPRSVVAALAAAAMSLLLAPAAQAELKQQNIAHLISSSQSIVAGTVRKVSDGVDANGMPYTEVTMDVGSSVKGAIKTGGQYTFRQFGLTQPRTMPNGRRLLVVTPPELPRWHENEYVVAFLYHPAARTGLQTTTGLAQGKFVKVNERISNQFGNAGLFAGVQARPGTLTASEQALLSSKGPVEVEAFMSLLRHVVQDQLIQTGGLK